MSELYGFVIGQSIRLVFYLIFMLLTCIFFKTLCTDFIRAAQSLYFFTSISFHCCNMNISHKQGKHKQSWSHSNFWNRISFFFCKLFSQYISWNFFFPPTVENFIQHLQSHSDIFQVKKRFRRWKTMTKKSGPVPLLSLTIKAMPWIGETKMK